MDFGLEKCAKCTIKKGKKTKSVDKEIEEGRFIVDLENDTTYTYLGIEENATLEHKKLRDKAKQSYIKRLKKICRSQLSPKNKITAINQMATPVLSYGFGIIDWPQRDIDNLDTKTRKILTIHKIIYRNQCLERLYLPRREGGMGLLEINDVFRKTMINLDYYIKNTAEQHMEKVRTHHQEDLPPNKSIIKLADTFRTSHYQNNNKETTTENTNETQQLQNQEENRNTKHPYMHYENINKKNRWQNNKRAGKFYEETQKKYIDKKASFQWLQNGELKYDEERLLLAAQDQ